ncbi:MAG TPA: hypothetical protein VG537_01220 [Candidatus Kapabacteria bacterium]|jgi:hypothetical protein|nr:hypothetical protein [Candidatus Kapabacteria bacterium]
MIKRYSILIVAVAAFIASGCGLFTTATKPTLPSTPYPPLSNALDEEYLHSPAGDMAARYPAGWLHVDIATIPMQNVLEVYTDPERARALVLTEIPGTAEFRRSVERDGMTALADASFAMKSAKMPGKLTITRAPEIYTVSSKLFASYQYAETGSDTLRRKENRIVVFTTGAKFYELGLIELGTPSDPAQHIQNFRLLESVIGSLEGAAEVRNAADTTSF